MMLNHYTLLCLLAIIAFMPSMPANANDSKTEQDFYNDKNTIFSRAVANKIEGTTENFQTAGISYRQIQKNGKCLVEYDGKLHDEGSVVKTRKKTFRVEGCLLERVYHACGPKLLLMLSLVCRVVEQEKPPSTIKTPERTPTVSSVQRVGSSAYKIKRVLAESCCENLCNVAELTRYCH